MMVPTGTITAPPTETGVVTVAENWSPVMEASLLSALSIFA